MSNHDDFVDDYIEYRIFEESMKRSDGGTWTILAAIVIVVLILLASNTLSSAKASSLPDSYNDKSSYHRSNINYEYPDNFRNLEDAEGY